MKKKVREKIRAFLNVAGVYLFTCVGILTRMYLPWAIAVGEGLESGLPEASTLVFVARIIAALILGTLIAGNVDRGGDPIGKDNNLGKRLYLAYIQGIGWYALIEIV